MILYHYCSNYVFHEIIRQKKVRLSLLNQSNDAREGRHILDLVEAIIPDEYKHKDKILTDLNHMFSNLLFIGFCLSEASNSLSQWRGYADDAQGVAIGFDQSLLGSIAKEQSSEDEDLYYNLSRVMYEEENIRNIITPSLERITALHNSGKMNPPIKNAVTLPPTTPISDEEYDELVNDYDEAKEAYFAQLLNVTGYSYGVKSRFFLEEKEWRLGSLVTVNNDTLDLKDACFQVSSNQLKPYQNFPLKFFPPSLIKEVVLGPKHQTPVEVVRLFLDSNDLHHVKIIRSRGTYR